MFAAPNIHISARKRDNDLLFKDVFFTVQVSLEEVADSSIQTSNDLASVITESTSTSLSDALHEAGVPVSDEVSCGWGIFICLKVSLAYFPWLATPNAWL